jgi:hypothetical protein
MLVQCPRPSPDSRPQNCTVMADTAAGNLALLNSWLKIKGKTSETVGEDVDLRAFCVEGRVLDPFGLVRSAWVMRRETKKRCGSWRHHHQDYAGNPIVPEFTIHCPQKARKMVSKGNNTHRIRLMKLHRTAVCLNLQYRSVKHQDALTPLPSEWATNSTSTEIWSLDSGRHSLAARAPKP